MIWLKTATGLVNLGQATKIGGEMSPSGRWRVVASFSSGSDATLYVGKSKDDAEAWIENLIGKIVCRDADAPPYIEVDPPSPENPSIRLENSQ